MEIPPGSNANLDRLVAKALARGKPNAAVDNACLPRVPLVVAACIHGRLDLAKALFAAGATMTVGDFQQVVGWRPEIGMVRFLVGQGVADTSRFLRYAVACDRWETVFLLLDHSVHVQEPAEDSKRYISLLHVATWQNNASAVQGLLARGAEVDRRDFEGMTPLMMACFVAPAMKDFDLSIVSSLLERGADPNARNPEGETPLLICMKEPSERRDARRELVQMLLKAGADPNVATPTGMTPLLFAARDNDPVLKDALMRAGATVVSVPSGDREVSCRGIFVRFVPEREKNENAIPRILVVNDEAHLRAAFRKWLGETGFEVETVASGAEALDRIRECRPDVLVSDYFMPEMDGYDLLVTLRRDPALADLPVIMMVSPYHGGAFNMTWYKTHADRYMPTPFNPVELIAVIRRLLAGEGLSEGDWTLSDTRAKRSTSAKASNEFTPTALQEYCIQKRALWWQR